jgi:hypothetical protein
MMTTERTMAALSGRTPLVVGFLQMGQSGFGMFGRHLGVVLLAVLDRFLQILHAGFRISTGLFLLSILGLLEGGRGVFDERRSVSFLPSSIASFVCSIACSRWLSAASEIRGATNRARLRRTISRFLGKKFAG